MNEVKETKKKEATDIVKEYKIYPKKDSALYREGKKYPYIKSGIPIDAEAFSIKDGVIKYYDGDILMVSIPLSNVDYYTEESITVPAGRKIEVD